MPKRVTIPVKTVGSDEWAQLSVFGKDHLVCAEEFRVKEQNYSFVGGHRVRLISLKKNVHWRVPAGTLLDLSDVQPAGPPPRRQAGR